VRAAGEGGLEQREVDPAGSRKEREFEVEELQVCVQLGGEALL
jgi:hypothetical protein